jgi:hypothetical protein
MSTPYAIEKVKVPVRLPGRGERSHGKIAQRLDRLEADAQMYVLQEALGRFGKPVEEYVYCLVDLVVELIRD